MTFYILNVRSGYVLDFSKPADGIVTLFETHGGTNQLWTYKDKMIHSKKYEGYVLQVSDDSRVEVKPSTGKPNQKWHFYDNNIINIGTGLYLDTKGDDPKKGDELIVYAQHTCENQRFRQIYITEKF